MKYTNSINEHNIPDTDDPDMLIVAITQNKPNVVAKMLNSTEYTREDLGEALTVAAGIKDSEKIMEILIEYGADPHYSDHSPIHAAVNSAEPSNVQYLLDQGCVVDSELLMEAINTRDGETVKIVLEAGVDPNVHIDDALPIEKAAIDDQWHIVKILLPYTELDRVETEIRKQIQKRYHTATMEGIPDLKPTPPPIPKPEITLPEDDNGIPNLKPRKAQFVKVYNTFDEQVKAAATDLLNYPNDHVKILAKNMQIKDCENIPHDKLCKYIAEKLIYINSETAPTDNGKCERYTKKLTEDEITDIRQKVYKRFKKFKNSVPEMSTSDLHEMLKMYDDLCFDGDVQKFMKKADYDLEFRTTGEETFTTEGICTFKKCRYLITIPTHYFTKKGGITIVAGHECRDQLECLLRVIEHEMTHLIIFMFCSDPFITDQHGPLFMNMVYDLFGHTDHRHYIF